MEFGTVRHINLAQRIAAVALTVFIRSRLPFSSDIGALDSLNIAE
ncbi:MAG: hypothetical protein OXN84_16335 [Albidovulum sp.]|nr:hypothetical protein [Albidovulum sp.]